MASAPDQAVLDLYAEFIRLRQTGTNRDDAWYAVLDLAEEQRLRDAEVKRLLVLAKGWEKREGYQYHYRSVSSKHDTVVSSESPIKPIPPRPAEERGPNAPEPPRNAALTGNLNPEALRAYEQRRLEQVLEQAEEKIEADPVPSSPPTPGGTRPINLVVEDRSPEYFGPESVLLMFFVGHQNPLQVRLEGNQEALIGRNTSNSAMSVDVDLEKVHGGEYGVSRMHGALTRRDNCLLITDIGSMNGTTINGQRLHPHEIRVLRDNDEIWFAQLRCKVRFWHPQQK